MDSEVKSPLTTPLPPGSSGFEAAGSSERELEANSCNNALGFPPASGEAVIKRRAPIACKRCRRMRSKCLHDKKPPCKSCKEAGIAAELCIFPVRGQPDKDREYRHPRARAEKSVARITRVGADALPASTPSPAGPGQSILGKHLGLPDGLPNGADAWQSLPALPDIIDAVTNFTRHYFQLGFLPKQMFLEQLRINHRSVNPFLLLGIISVSARFTPSLIKQYGSGIQAAEAFMASASQQALKRLYDPPSLEVCQGFYLLSIAQQGNGYKNLSFLNLGIAVRMAALLRLHREETYHKEYPTKKSIVEAESARRTLWMLHSQDNLHSDPLSPVSLATSDITALLPSNEEDFANGCEPITRAALTDTPPAKANHSLTTDKSRSLFASLIQTHYYWGEISRRAVSQKNEPSPWDEESEYTRSVRRLNAWEESLPDDHQFSYMLLKGYKAEGLDLAYLAVTMVVPLCNIVLRKPYMHLMLAGNNQGPRSQFWGKMSFELFTNVALLYRQIDAKFKDRGPQEGTGAQIMAFCIYTCGILSAHLCKNPNICPDPIIAKMGPVMLSRCMEILFESKAIWPLADEWCKGLQSFVNGSKNLNNKDGTMADGRDPVPQALKQSTTITPSPEVKLCQPEDDRALLSQPPMPRKPIHHELLSMPDAYTETPPRFTAINAQHPSHFQSQHHQPQHQQHDVDPRHHQHPHQHQPPLHQQQQQQHQHPQQHSQHHLVHQQQHHQQHQHQQQQQIPPQHDPARTTRESYPNGINLLVEVLKTNPDSIGGSGAVHPSPPADIGPFAGMSGDHHVQHDSTNYYTHADGYTDSLLSYLCENQAHPWVPPGAVFNYHVNVSESM